MVLSSQWQERTVAVLGGTGPKGWAWRDASRRRGSGWCSVRVTPGALKRPQRLS